MKRRFASLPLHRKLVILVLAVSTLALIAALLGFTAFDLLRFRSSAGEDAAGLAQVIADNTTAALVFNDADAARETLNSVRVRPLMALACLYRPDGTLLAGYERPGRHCPVTPTGGRTWRTIAIDAPVLRNGQTVGHVYIERTLEDLAPRIAVTLAAGGLTLLVVLALAAGLAQRFQGVISRPIIELAGAARSIGRDEPFDVPHIEASPDETGELVRAFEEMVRRLLLSNETLRAEVDERRRMQVERETLLTREREANRLKDEFLAAVSHELRTPLNAILGWAQILERTRPTEATVAKAVASLTRNARAQNRVIEDLLDVSRIITGKMQLVFAALDLRSVIESTIEVIAPIAEAKHVRINVHMPSVPCIAHADFDRLRQVMWNLISNAVKFTSNGGAVDVRLSEQDTSFSIAVTDTGIGIPSQFVPHVFERFRQGDGSTTREHGGLGLGLAIVKELTELHGGTVQASSAGPGRGATFTVSLPRLTDDASVNREGPPPRTTPRLLDGLTVLVVDDSADALEIIRITLAEAGAAVVTAHSGSDALEYLRRNTPDVIVCDLAMPGMDGFEVLRRIGALDSPKARSIPVLALSAYASGYYQQRCLAAGFHGHIAKPFESSELIRAVAGALR